MSNDQSIASFNLLWS